MATKPILTVDVQSSGFTAFVKQFDDYAEAVQQHNQAWRDLKQIATGSLSPIAKEADKITKSTGRLNIALAGTATAFGKVGVAAGGVLKIVERIGSIIGKVSLIGGIATGAGLFGLDKLAGAVYTQTRTAAGINLTPGQLNALRVNMQRYVSPDTLASAAALAQNDLSKQGYLAAIGISPGQATRESPFDLSLQIAQRARAIGQAGPIRIQDARVQALMQLGLGIEDIRRLSAAPAGQFGAAVASARRDMNSVGYPQKVADEWSRLLIQMDRAGKEIEAIFVTALAKLADPLSRLSQSVVDVIGAFLKGDGMAKIIDDVAKGMEKLPGIVEGFAKYLASPEFQGKFVGFVADVEKAGRELFSVIDGIYQFMVRLGLVKPEPTHNEFVKAFGNTKAVPPLTSGMPEQGIWTGKAEVPNFRQSGAYAASNLHSLALKYGSQYQIPSGLLDRMLMVESSYGAGSMVSPAGAMGPMQLMPGTAAQLGVDPFNPDQGIHGGARYLADMYRYYGDWDKALAAYNWGPGNLDKDMKAHGAAWRDFLPAATSLYLRQTTGSLAGQEDAAVKGAIGQSSAIKNAQRQPFGSAPSSISSTTSMWPMMTLLQKQTQILQSMAQQASKTAKVSIQNSAGAQIAIQANNAAVQ